MSGPDGGAPAPRGGGHPGEGGEIRERGEGARETEPVLDPCRVGEVLATAGGEFDPEFVEPGLGEPAERHRAPGPVLGKPPTGPGSRESGPTAGDPGPPVAPEPRPQEPEGRAVAPRRITLTRWRPYRESRAVVRDFLQRLSPFPYLAASMVAICVVLYGMMLVLGYDAGLLVPAAVGLEIPPLFGAVMGERVFASNGPAEWWRLVTGAFLHGSLLHLGINMAMLMMLGRIFENLFGSPRFLVLLVASILSASALSAWVRPDAISMGASGAVMGLVGAGISFGRRHRRRIPEALHPFFGTNLVVYAALVFGLGLLPGLPIDHWGHFGGFVGGALCGALLRPVVLEPEGAPARWGTLAVPFGLSVLVLLGAAANVAPRIAGASEHVVAPHIAAAMKAVDSGDLDKARKEVDLALEKAPEDPLVLMQAAELYSVAGESQEAVELYTRLSRVIPPERWRAPMRNNFGWSLFMGRPEDRAAVAQGLALVAQDLAEDPKQPTYLNSLAYGQWLAGQYLEAFQTIERTMEIGGVSQRSSDIYIYVMARAGIGDLAGAREVFAQARAVWPEGTLAEEARRVVEERWFPAGPPLERETPGVTPLIRDPVPATMLAKAARERKEPAPPANAPVVPPPIEPALPPPPPGGPAADAGRGEPAESAWTPPKAEWAEGAGAEERTGAGNVEQ